MPWMEGETVVLGANSLIFSNRHLDARLAADVAGVTVAALTEKLEERLFVIVVGFLGCLVDFLDPLVHYTNERLISSCSVETSVHGLLRFLAELVEFSAGICVGERGHQLTADVGILERLHGTVNLGAHIRNRGCNCVER